MNLLLKHIVLESINFNVRVDGSVQFMCFIYYYLVCEFHYSNDHLAQKFHAVGIC